MSTDYEKSSFEQKAFELLAPLAGNCPDSVWDNVNIELAARKAAADNKWFKKAATSPKTVLVAAGVIAVVTLSSWMLFMNKSSHTTVAVDTTVQQPPQPVKQTPVKEDKPAPVAVVNTNNTTPQAPVPIPTPAPAPIVNQPVAQKSPVVIQNASLVTPAPVANKPVVPVQKLSAIPSNTNGSPLIGHNDPVFDVSASPDAATLKGSDNKQRSDSSATMHRGVSSVQADLPIMDTAQ